MKYSDEIKNIWWDYLLKNDSMWPNGVTLRRLKSKKKVIFLDKHIWSDLIDRHGGWCGPGGMDEYVLTHAVSNFFAQIRDIVLAMSPRRGPNEWD